MAETIIRGTRRRDRMAAVNLRFALPLALVLCAVPAYGQTRAATPSAPRDATPDPSHQTGETATGDGVARLLNRLEQLLQQNNRDDFPSLLSTPDLTGAEAEQATDDLFSYETIRAAVRERDRTPLEGSLPGDGYHVIVEIMTETPARARVLTARLRCPAATWRRSGFVAHRRNQPSDLRAGPLRLRLDASTQYIAREFTIRAQDVQFTLHTGSVFQVLSGEGVTGLVLLGRGEMQFAPGPADRERPVANLQRQRNADRALRRRFRSDSSGRLRNSRRRLGPPRCAGRSAASQARAGRLRRRGAEVVQHRPPRSESRDLVHPAAERRLPRGGPHQQVRHADLLAQRRQRRGRHAVRARAQTRHLALRITCHARCPRRDVQRRRSARLRRDRLQHRHGRLSPIASSSRDERT